MLEEENVVMAAIEHFPFLARYVKYPSIWNVYLEPVNAELADRCPEIRGSLRCPQQVQIVLLNSKGGEIGFVGQHPKVVPPVKFLWWTFGQSKTISESFWETVLEALRRFSEPASWIVVISEQNMVGGYNTTLYFPPNGQTINECLDLKLTEKIQTEEKRRQENDANQRELELKTLTEQRELLKRKLGLGL